MQTKPTIMDRLEAGIRNRIPQVVVNLASYGKEHAGVAPVVVVANTVGTKDQMRAALSKALAGVASPIENTFQSIVTNGSPAFVGFVRANKQTRVASESEVAKMTVMAGNMLLDAEDDTLWRVQEDTTGGKVLQRQGQDALSKLLETAKVNVTRAPEATKVTLANVNVGDFACFIDPVTANVRFGVVVAAEDGTTELHTNEGDDDVEKVGELHDSPSEGLEVPEPTVEILPVASDEPIEVKAAHVIMAAELTGEEKVPEVTAPRQGSAKERMVSYYSRLYGHNKEFFRKLENIIQQNTAF